MQDLLHSLRLIRKNPAFTAVSVLALAIGIGANTAIFSMVNAVLLRNLQFKNPEELVWIWSLGRGVRLVVIGVVLGLIGGLASTRLVSSLLFGVTALDPLAFAMASALLAVVGISASYFPARKATAVDPISALRSE